MTDELGKEINKLKRRLNLYQQALEQNNILNEKYNLTLSLLNKKEKFISTVIESNINAIIAIDENQIVTIFNKSAEKMFGYKKEEMLHKDSLHKIIPDDLVEKHKKAVSNFIATKKSIGFLNSYVELKGKKKDGTIFPVRIGFGVDINNEGIVIVANIEDITEEKKAKEDLEKLNQSLERKIQEKTKELDRQYKYLQSIIDGIDDGVLVIDYNYNISLKNSAVKKYFGDIKEKKNLKCYELYRGYKNPCHTYNKFCPLEYIKNTKKPTTLIYQNNGNYMELVSSPLCNENRECIGIVQSIRDVTNHLELQKKLEEQKNIFEYQANHDMLTGLANRIYFNKYLKEAIERAKRNHRKLAVFFIDLNKFKYINDTFGHDVGDMVLKETAKRLKSVLRITDIIARLGGDEFTVIIEDLEHKEDAFSLAEKMCHSLKEKPLIYENQNLEIDASIGVAIYPDNGADLETLLKYADMQMYKIKKEKKSLEYINSIDEDNIDSNVHKI